MYFSPFAVRIHIVIIRVAKTINFPLFSFNTIMDKKLHRQRLKNVIVDTKHGNLSLLNRQQLY